MKILKETNQSNGQQGYRDELSWIVVAVSHLTLHNSLIVLFHEYIPSFLSWFFFLFTTTTVLLAKLKEGQRALY